MKRFALPLVVSFALLGLALLPTHPAAADDETGDTEIKIHEPLDAVDCTANTISILGLTINVSTAAIDAGSGDGGDQGDNQSDGQGGSDSTSGGDNQGGDGGDSGGSNGGATGCAALVAGQPVEVKLVSDSMPLVATEVSQNGDANEVKVEAPIQAVNANAKTITVLGVVVDVSQASMGGADDDSQDGNSQPIDLTQVMEGQFVEMLLASNQPPLSATEVRVINFTNQVDVEVDDANGQEVDDVDESGNAVDDVDVDVAETVTVQNTAPGSSATASQHVNKVLQLHRTSNGSVVLSGLATGRAKISVTRTVNGVTAVGHSIVHVRPNARRQLRIRLHLVPSSCPAGTHRVCHSGSGRGGGYHSTCTCVANPPPVCVTSYGSRVASGSSVTLYDTLTATYPDTCAAHGFVTTCVNAVFNPAPPPSYGYIVCNIVYPDGGD
jgi:hypothetical protein